MRLPCGQPLAPPARYRDLSFRCHFGQNGVAELPALMTPSAGGSSELPVFRFVGGMADATDWTTWDYPGTPVACARQAVGVQPTYNDGSPLLGPDDDSVLFHASDYYKAPNTTFGQVATEDFVLEAVFKAPTIGTAEQIAGTREGGAGWRLYLTAAGTIRCRVQDGVAGASITAGTVESNTWYHILFFMDRSGFGVGYLNGAAGAAVDISGAALTADSGSELGLGARGTGNEPSLSAIAYLALWKKAAWLTSHLNPDTAAERFGLLAGYWPQVAKGTAAPNTATRAYAAYTEKIESSKTRLYMVGSEWLRLAQRIDGNGETVTGYLAEPEATNDLAESNDFTAWTASDAGDVITDDAATGPDNMTSMATLVCDNTNGEHALRRTTGNVLSAANHCASIVIGTGGATWWKIAITTIANAHCWFNMTTGALGTKGAGCDEAGFVNALYHGSGTYVRLPYIRFLGTAANHTMKVFPCDGDGVDTFSGGDSVAVTGYLWQAQVEEGDYPTSRINADGGAATRLKDQLQFKGDDGNLGGVGSEERGAVEFFVRVPAHTPSVATTLLEISDGGSADDRLTWQMTSTGYVQFTVVDATVTTADITGTNVMIADGEWHRIFVSWRENDVRLTVDSTHEGRDTGCTIPDDLDRGDIGQSRSAGSQPVAQLSDVQFYRREKRRAA